MAESGVVSEEADLFDWQHLLDNTPDDFSFFNVQPDLSSDRSFNSSSSIINPDSLTFSFDEIEQLLMNNEGDNGTPPAEAADLGIAWNTNQFPSSTTDTGFLSEILLESPSSVDCDDGSVGEVFDVPLPNLATNDSKLQDNNSASAPYAEPINDEGEDLNDPNSKKRKRQLRNRDAAVRSRERKKMYVKDLELKSRYFEGECKRLGMLLQCYLAENQALRLSLQSATAFDASRTRQESAVLLLESLLLGSLLWFLGILCLLILPRSTLEAIPLEDVDSGNRASLDPIKRRNKFCELVVLESFMMGKRCKASRSRMKHSSLMFEVLV